MNLQLPLEVIPILQAIFRRRPRGFRLKSLAAFGDGNPDGLALLKEKEKKLKEGYEWAWLERIDAEFELHKATFGCNGGNRQSDREVLAMLQARKHHMMNGMF
jgi:hypothetical protein